MKRKAINVLLAAALLAVVVPASAHRYHRLDDGHPLRIIAHIVHPVGIALEYGIMRPIHYIVSQPDADIIFGHKSFVEDEPTYFEWVHGDYEPSIAVEREMREKVAAENVR